MDESGRATEPAGADSRVTWRLVVPPRWGSRGDPNWLPANGGEAWRSLFATEDMAGRFLRDQGQSLPWRVAAQSSFLLASVLGPYRAQLRVAEGEAERCQWSSTHLAAIAGAGEGAEPPSRSHPPGPWRVRAWEGDKAVLVARHPSVDGAEGDAAARRTGDGAFACWAEPDVGPAPPTAPARGWTPRVDRDLRYAAFAVEEAIVSLCAGAADGATGPDVLDVGLLCLLGQAAWRSVHEYRTLLAAAWGSLEACPAVDEHEAGAAASIATDVEPGTDGPAGPWRHVRLLRTSDGAEPIEVSVHAGQAGASASVAVARATEDEETHWAEPVVAGPRRDLGDVAGATR